MGYTVSNTLKAAMVIRTVKEAVSHYGKSEIINSDQGVQSIPIDYIKLIKSFKTTKISMDGRVRATDKIAIERFL